MGVPYINLAAFPISPEALSLISSDDALAYQVICFYKTDREAKLATTSPESHTMAEFGASFAHAHDVKVEIYLISDLSFRYAYRLYAALPKISPRVPGIEIKEDDLKKYQSQIKTFQDLDREIQKASISDLLTLVIAGAVAIRQL